MSDFKIKKHSRYDCGWYISDGHNNYLWKDLTVQKDTGFLQSSRKHGEAPGYYHSAEEAKQYLDAYLYIENLKDIIKICKSTDEDCGWYVFTDGYFLWKDEKLHYDSTGYRPGHSRGQSPGYYFCKKDAVYYADIYLTAEKEKQLNKIKGIKMANNYVVIEGKTINLSDETVRNLKKELGIKDLESGDIVVSPSGLTYLAWQHPTDENKLNIHASGHINATVYKNNTYYKSTGNNIFKDNLLNLAS